MICRINFNLKEMKILEEMKLKDVIQLVGCLQGNKSESQKSFFEVGVSYFIRTVTMYLVGTIKNISGKEILMENAAWIADSGRFYDALKTGTLNEVEPFIQDVIVNRDCIVDATIWTHNLPLEQK